MRILDNKYTRIFIATAILLLPLSCEQEITEEEKKDQEERFFNIYRTSHYPDAVLQSSGIYYLEHRAGSGISPDEDDWMLVNHVCYTIPDERIYETYVENVAVDNDLYDASGIYGPFKMQNGNSTLGLQQGMMLMKEGAQATILFTSELGYGSGGSGKKVSPYESLKFEIELLEVIKDIEAYEETRILQQVQTMPGADTIYDPGTGAVMYYIVDEPSDGPPLVSDSLIQVAYRGYLIDGRVFDERTADNPLEMTVGKESIKGWDLGLPRLKVGEKARFVIPYQLAYGETGRYDTQKGIRLIPPYETLLFDLEIISQKEAPPAE